MINLRQESRKPPISLENIFGVVADDLQRLNDNLLAVSSISATFIGWFSPKQSSDSNAMPLLL